jgi:transposase
VLKAHVLKFDRLITAWHRSNETSRRLDALPGVGPALATALVATSAIRRHSDRGEASQHGSDWCRGRAPAEEKLGSISSKATAICAACSQLAH